MQNEHIFSNSKGIKINLFTSTLIYFGRLPTVWTKRCCHYQRHRFFACISSRPFFPLRGLYFNLIFFLPVLFLVLLLPSAILLLLFRPSCCCCGFEVIACNWMGKPSRIMVAYAPLSAGCWQWAFVERRSGFLNRVTRYFTGGGLATIQGLLATDSTTFQLFGY